MIALLFPGQGSQQPGMGADLASAFPAYRSAITEASAIIGRDLLALMTDGTAEELKATENAQVVVYVMSCAIARVLEIDTTRIACVAGHSLGELSAATVGGGLAYEDGIRLVRERSQLMGRAVAANPGTMAAVLTLNREQIEEVIRPLKDVWVANHNAPEQTVIAGSHAAVASATELLKEAGARRVLPLPVAGAFHSPLMASAAADFRHSLASAPVTELFIPLIANTDAERITSADDLRGELGRQVEGPVEWVASVKRMNQMGATTFIEIGPGKVLSGLVRRILPEVTVLNLETAGDLQALASEDGPDGLSLTEEAC